jgi:hypothetical protein
MEHMGMFAFANAGFPGSLKLVHSKIACEMADQKIGALFFGALPATRCPSGALCYMMSWDSCESPLATDFTGPSHPGIFLLVGGLEHSLFCHILGIIIP